MTNGIRFLVSDGVGYGALFKAHVLPVIKYLPESQISDHYEPGYINVSLSREAFPKAEVFMHHGISDKLYRETSKMMNYDTVFVPGPAWRDKLVYQGMSPKRIHIIGYPFMDEIFKEPLSRPPLKRTADYVKYGIPTDDMKKPLVVWAPTHRGTAVVSSQGRLNNVINNESWITKETQHPVYSGFFFRDILPLADVVVADSGSTLYEAWAYGVPVVFPSWLIKDSILGVWPNSFEAKIYRERLGWHANSENELVDMIKQAIKTKNIGSGIEPFMEGIFPQSLRGCSGKRAAQALTEIATGGC